MQTPKFGSQHTAQDLITTALMAFDKLQEGGGGQIYMVFFDLEQRETEFIYYHDEDPEETYCEVNEALDRNLRPICLSILPFADPIIISLHAEPSIDDLAVMESITEDIDASELKTDTCK